MPYHTIRPLAAKDTYTWNDQFDYYLSFAPGESLVQNSIRVSGNSLVRVSNVNAGTPEWNSKIGIHGFFSGWTTQFDTLGPGIIENVDGYGRFCKMKIEADTDENDNGTNADAVAELRMCNDSQTRYLKDPVIPTNFSFKPLIALNKMSGDLSSQSSGNIKISGRIVPNVDALHSTNAGDVIVSTLVMTNLQLTYETTIEQPAQKCLLDIVRMVPFVLESSSSSITTTVPMVVKSVSVSFIQRSKVSTATADNYMCQGFLPTGIKQLTFNYNDTNNLITYPIYSESEMLYLYKLSLSKGSHGSNLPYRTNSNVRSDNAFGIGMTFGDAVDLTNQSWSFELKSDDIGTGPNAYNAYVYFQGSILV